MTIKHTQEGLSLPADEQLIDINNLSGFRVAEIIGINDCEKLEEMSTLTDNP